MRDQYMPAAPDPVMMPVGEAWLDMSTKPYRLHLKASVVHGTPIVIEVNEDSQRLTIRPQSEPDTILVSGPYQIDTTPITGPEAIAAGIAPGLLTPRHNESRDLN